MPLHLPTLRAAARAGRITWRYHALVRASQRGISRAQALRVIQHGEIIEERPRAKPWPKCLMMALVESQRPLYVSLAYDGTEQRLHVITVHWHDPRKWEDPWTRRLMKRPRRKAKKP